MFVKNCRICGNKPLIKILKLGKMPAVNYFPEKGELNSAENQKRYPLNFLLCSKCGLAQLDFIVPPNKLFRNYHYLTSASQPLINHFRSLAVECSVRRFIHRGAKVLDIGSNDGTLLQELRKEGVKPLGVDPARNAITAAEKIGIQVLPYFFDVRTAKKIRAKHGQFQLITSTNVFAHTHHVKEFLEGVRILLAPTGVLILEFAHLLDMVIKNQFDVIYHEHVSYFSLHSLIYLFGLFDIELFDAKKILTQGGSLRVYARLKQAGSKSSRRSANVEAILQEERDNHLSEPATLRRFAADVRQFRSDIRQMIRTLKSNGRKIVGFGAPAKGVILLNYCGITHSDIQYIVDSTPLKQGRYLPGTKIPVYAERRLENGDWDYLLLLSWNFQETILEKLKPYRQHGAKVIIPFPKLRIV